MKDNVNNSGEWVSVMKFLEYLGERFSDSDTRHVIEHLANEKMGIFSKTQARREKTKGAHRTEKLELFKSPRTRIFVLNLLYLHSFLRPAHIKSIVHEQGCTLKKDLDHRFKVIRHRITDLQDALSQEDELKKRILTSSLDLSETLLPRISNEVPANSLNVNADSTIRLPEDLIARLHHMRIIEDSEANAIGNAEEKSSLPEQALHFFQMGCIDIAKRIVDSILENDKANGMACYVAALLFLKRHDDASNEANEASFISELTENDESGLVSDAKNEESLIHAANAAQAKEDALRILVIALKNWPESGGRYFHHEHRIRALRLILSEASTRGLAKWASIEEVSNDAKHDKTLVDILRKEERQRWLLASPSLSAARIDLLWLHLYSLLDAKLYKQFAKDWIANLPKCSGTALIEIQTDCLFLFHLSNLALPEQAVALLKRVHETIVNWQREQSDSLVARITFNELERAYAKGDFVAALENIYRLITLRTNDRVRYEYLHIRILYDWSVALLEDGKTAEAAQKWLQILAAYPDVIEKFGAISWLKYLNEVDEDSYEYGDDLGNSENILFRHEFASESDQPSPLLSLCDRIRNATGSNREIKDGLDRLLKQYRTIKSTK